ncbi:LADA_0A00562g1_1 [Lachancea dasiensis]|uniref:Serine/threonine-protein phosphatase 2A activator n=1 Tax=Lachancea dasiensis TaxID=1072105 RepID=A0A1G4ILQ9_9SACH|nr:LADA_0A00562g1_1 [Lachancea dasiensis]
MELNCTTSLTNRTQMLIYGDMNNGETEIAIDARTTSFEEPTKRVFDSRGTQLFQNSVAMYRLKMYLHRYMGLMHNVKVPQQSNNAKIVEFIGILQKLETLVNQTPAIPGPRRYGNLACRDWHDKVEAVINTTLEDFLPIECHKSIVEVRYYLANAFGSRERLDYGTGHELSFFALVCALDMLGVWPVSLTGADLLFLFDRYYALVRKLVLAYSLEPAGSHGVWGLDDHFHLMYIFGASQWADSRTAPVMPKDVQSKSVVVDYAPTNLYCQGLSFVFQVKSGHFSENSPMLYDISQTVPTWSKVQRGLLKMYFAEVLNKCPVVQHFWFGTGLFPWTSPEGGFDLPTYESSAEAQPAPTPMITAATMRPAPVRHSMKPPNFHTVGRFTSQDRFRKG